MVLIRSPKIIPLENLFPHIHNIKPATRNVEPYYILLAGQHDGRRSSVGPHVLLPLVLQIAQLAAVLLIF